MPIYNYSEILRKFVVSPDPASQPAPVATVADDSVIDITGLLQHLTAEPNRAAPSSSFNYFTSYNYEPPLLGHIYGEKLALNPAQIRWLNKFWCPSNAFLAVESNRQTAALLYVEVLGEIERQFKLEGTTLPKEIKALAGVANQAYRANYGWYYGKAAKSSAGTQMGADIYLTLFRICENAVREQLGHKRKINDQFSLQLPDLDRAFEQRFGQRVQALLPALVRRLPAPDEETELELNKQTITRWKARFATLAALLPADVPGFTAGVLELGRLNARNPTLEKIYFEAAKLVARTDREAALRFYLYYLSQEYRGLAYRQVFASNLQKILFPEPEHLRRFEEIMAQFARDKNLVKALADVASVYVRERKKITLDMGTVRAVRRQHSGTVELLNSYLQDEPADEPAPPPTAPPPGKPTKKQPKAAKAITPLQTTKTAKAAGPSQPPAASVFAPSLALNATQQALLLLFANPNLTLAQAKVEAFAKSQNTLRNQLIDSINDCCYELLDDVLIEENGDDYAIYEPYFQKITA